MKNRGGKAGRSLKEAWKKYGKYVLLCFILYLLIHYWSTAERAILLLLTAIAPLAAGAVIAYIVNIPMAFLEKLLFGRTKRKVWQVVKRPVCLLLSFVLVIGVVVLICELIVPKLVFCINLLIQKLPPVLAEFYRSLDEQFALSDFFTNNVRTGFGDINDWRDLVEKAVNVVINGFGGVMGSVFTVISAVFSAVFSLFVAVAFSVYLLLDKEKLAGNFRRVAEAFVPEKRRTSSLRVIRLFDDNFHRFIVGQCTEAVVLGVLCFIGMSVFRFPLASMISALVGFTALVPIAGAYIGAGVGAFLIFTEASFLKAVFFLIFILVLQQLENNLIYPKVVGASIGLPGIWVLAAITIGGALDGVVGMLISVPLASSLYKMLRENTLKRTGSVPLPPNREQDA